ncbi:MFS family permease [Natronocella acetinitrilica]|uniref:MFS family permease n=2 Tax=Natronocella acetinitrilica TaxID=414046 RepID=A0AAE3GBI7_9GAMM|nr:MFS family permease [Natronocella acetinitrilica]
MATAPGARPLHTAGKPSIGILLRLMLPFGFGYYLSHVYRSVNAVIAPDLVRSIGLGAADLGLLTSAFMLAFALAQLPLGVLLDRYGARRVDVALLLLAVMGALLFAVSESVLVLAVGRALMGLGVAACMMAAFKSMTMVLPISWLMPAQGLLVAVGGVGAMTATAPAETLVRLFGWRSVFVLLATATVIAAVCVYLFVPDEEARVRRRTSWRREMAGLKRALLHPFFLAVGPAIGLVQGGFIAIQTLWAGPWLYYVVGLDSTTVSHYLLLIACGMVGGYVFNGFLGAVVIRWGVSPIVIAIVGSAIMLLSLALIILLGPLVPLPIWIVFGFFGTSVVVCFAMIGQQVPGRFVGRVSTAVNFMTFATAFVFQWGIGAMVQFWTPDTGGHYPDSAFKFAFTVTLSVQAAGLVILALSGVRMHQARRQHVSMDT